MFTSARVFFDRRFACLVAALSLVVIVAAPAHAVNRFWTNVGVGGWFDSTNWSGGAVPTVFDRAFIDNGGTAQVTATGAVADAVIVGFNNTGSLDIKDGGSLLNNTTDGDIGSISGSSGTVTVDGASSLWTGIGELRIGDSGNGTLNVTDGGAVSNSTGHVGLNAGSTGEVTVDGSGSTWTNNQMDIGSFGSGTLTISNAGTVSSNTLVDLGLSGGSSGTLNIGSGAGAGVFNALIVSGGSGTATLNFNHTDSNYFFTDDGTSGGTPIEIIGTIAVHHVGSGTTTLNGNNTYTGDTFIDAGTLRVSSNTNLGDAAGALTFNGGTLSAVGSFTMNRPTTLNAGGGTFDVSTANTTEQQGSISGAGALTMQGAGTLSLSGNNTYTGGTTVRNGTLQVTGAISHAGANTVVGVQSGDNGTLSIEGGNVTNDRAIIAQDAGSTGAVTVAGANGTWTNTANTGQPLVGRAGSGTLTIASQGTVHGGSGGVILAQIADSTGTLNIGSGGAPGILDTPTLFGGLGTATLNFNHTDSNYFFTDDGTSGGTPIDIIGSIAVHHVGSGTTTLNGNNTYTGNTFIDGGTLRVSSNTNLGDAAGTLTFNGGTLSAVGSFTMNRPTTLNAGGGTFDVSTANTAEQQAAIIGTGRLTKQGEGTLLLTGANSYSGGTTVNAGMLRAGSAGAFGDHGAYTVNGGTLDINDFNLTMGYFQGAGGTVDLGSATLVVDQAANSAYFGAITGSGNLTKQGGGSLTLTGNNSYTGLTDVLNGTLAITDGGTVNQLGVARIADPSGTTAAVTVDGATSTWSVDSILYAGIYGNGTLSIQNGGTVSSSYGELGFVNAGNGMATIDGPGSRWTISNDLAVGGSGTGTLTLQNGGKVEVNGSLRIARFGGGTGTLNIGSGGTGGIVDAASIEGVYTATLNFNHTDSNYFFTNDGTAGGTAVAITGSTAVHHLGSGTTTLTGSHTYTGPTTVDAGTLLVDGTIANSTITVNDGGTLGGSGSVANVIVSGGTISPGMSAGTLTVDGALVLGATSTLELEINGSTPETDYDVLEVTGAATLGGTLAVSVDPGFVPNEGEAFQVLTFASNGSTEFDNVTGLSLADGRALIADYGPTSVQLIASYFGDGNLDGTVDGLDYLLWAENFGKNPADNPPGAPGNGDYNNDGQVDGLDYIVWAGNFGEHTSANSVPEPSAVVLLVVAATLALMFRRRSQ